MEDKIVKIEFNIWANDEQEGVALTQAIRSYIDQQGAQGRKVSAGKLLQAINKWGNNPFVLQILNNYFK